MNNMPSEYIEITIYPKDRVELSEFTNALNALNAEYRQWLREHSQFNHKDQDLKLFVEKVAEGSIVVWITKKANNLFNNLEEFYTEHFSKIINDILYDKIVKPTISQLKSIKNIKTLIRWKAKFKYHSPARSVEIENDITWDNRDSIQEKSSKLLAGKESIDIENETIKFLAFDVNGNAKIVVPTYSDNEIKTFLSPSVKEFFIKETENFLHPDKEYLVNLTINYKNDIIDNYHIIEVIGE